MREILFRGKRIDNGEWVEGFYYVAKDLFDDNTHHYIIEIEAYLYPHGEVCGICEIDPSSVSQFTTLTDKNGKKIFEGDIVKTKFGRLCIVRYFVSSCYCGIDLFPLNTRHRPPTEYDMYRKEFLEVIDDIYDNPEPLETENE